jgi:hypothetical protein
VGFEPIEVSVPAGQMVIFRNTGAQSHSATASGGAFDTGLLGPGESKTLAAAAPVAKPAAQAVPTPTPFRLVSQPAPAATTSNAAAPRAGSMPMDLALPFVVGGGAAALAGATHLLRTRRRSR